MSSRTVHPFPARMAPEIALAAIPKSDNGSLTILDPMCGSGTVLTVALQRGQNAVGVDIDPLAVMVSRVATGSIDTANLMSESERVVSLARSLDGAFPWGDDCETQAFVQYWFGAQQVKQLAALTSVVMDLDSDEVRLALQVAISRLIITKSPQASLAADTAHSRPHRVIRESSYDVFDGFLRSVSQLARLLQHDVYAGTVSVSLGDARTLEHISDATVDMAVTSPPYLNALDYLRGHKLALVWFGYSLQELRRRRSSSIGAERAPDSDISLIAVSVTELLQKEVRDRTAIKEAMLERYAQDCVDFSLQLARTLKPNGIAVLVIGNSTLRGNYIRNDLALQAAMEAAGFAVTARYERDIPDSRRYMAINSRETSSTITNRMRKEIVLTMRRAA